VRPIENCAVNPVDFGVMLLCSILLLPVLRTGWTVSRKEGAMYLLIYAGYIGYLAFHMI